MNKMTQDMINIRYGYNKLVARGLFSCAATCRFFILMLLMLVVGVSKVMAQETPDYSGIYYIASDGNAAKIDKIEKNGKMELDPEDYSYSASTPESNYYLVPACDPVQNDWKDAYNDGNTGNKPLLTTYKVGQENEPNWSEAVWVVRQVTDNDGTFYYIMHAETGKYVIYNPMFTGNNSRRKCMHLDETLPNDNGKFVIEEYEDGVYDIVPKSMRNDQTTNHKFWNIADRNRNSRHGLDGNNYYGGMVGLFSYNTTTKKLDTNSRWKFEKAVPKVSSTTDDKVQLTFPVTTATTKICYTTDGSNPTGSSAEYTNSTNLTLPAEGNMVVKAIAVVSDGVTPTPNTASSEIATLFYKPEITLSQDAYTYNGGENKPTVSAVSITTTEGTTTADATAYSALYSADVTNAGTPTVTITDADESDFWYIWNASTSFTINQKEVGLTWTPNPTTLTYNGVGQSPTATATGLIGSDACTVTVGVSANSGSALTGDDAINIGEYTATATDLSNTNYKLPDVRTQVFTINKAPLTITANNNTITYGDAPSDNGVTYDGFVNSETESVLSGTLDYDYTYTQFGDVGNSYTITPKGLTSSNYEITFAPGPLTVDQKEVGLDWSETTSFIYDGTSHCLTATATGMVNSDEIGVTVTGEQTNAGNYTATASELTGAKIGNYKLPAENTHSFTINPVELTVTANDHSITYGNAPSGNGVTYDGFVNGETESVLEGTLAYTYSYSQYGDVGTYTITPKGLTGVNYSISYVNGTLTVNPKALAVTAEAKSKEYGDDDPALTYTSEGLVGSDAITGVLSRETGEDIGTYAIYQNTLTASSNYTISYTGANLTINPRSLSVTAKPKAITYGDAPANDGVTYSGFAPGEDENVLSGTITYSYNYSQYGNAGTYAITPGGLTGDNYNITYNNGTLTVNPKEVGITWGETTTFVYDANSHAPSATATGLLNGDEVDVSVTGQQTNVGDDYTATASGLTGDKAGNYTIDATYMKNFSITPAALTITAKDRTISYGDEPSNWGVNYKGFKGDDNEEVLTGTLAYAYNYNQYDELGDYTITPSGLTSTNYDITYHTGTLIVKARTIVLKWTNTSFTYDGEAHLPTATATGMVNGEEIGVTVSGAQTNAGKYSATASGLTGEKAGHYELPAFNTESFTISPKSLGDGDLPAEGITIQLTSEGELEYVKDGDITLTTDEDYTYDIRNEGSDQIVAVTGVGNYTGSLRGIYAHPQFYDIDGEGAGKATAVYMSSRDVNTFVGVNAYTVKSVNPSLGLITVNKLDYIPKGVPVLLLSDSEASGFVVTEKNENIDDISEGTVNSNLLKMAPEEGVPVENAQVYIFYKGEFVLTKAGTIAEGKFYLYNPNYTETETPAAPAPIPSRASLMIVEEEPTGMGDVLHFMNNEQLLNNDWYDLQGRKIESHKLSKGLYIHKGRKVIVK